MQVTLLCIGKTGKKFLEEGEQEYLKRLRHYISFQMQIIPDIKQAKSLSQNQVKQREGELILEKIGSSETLILLDERGKEFNIRAYSLHPGSVYGTDLGREEPIELFKQLGTHDENGNINIEEEIEKLNAELVYIKGFLKSVQGKLSNEKFVAGAPEKVIEMERKKEADALAKIATIEQSLAGLK